MDKNENKNLNKNTDTNTNKLINATILVSLLVIVSLLSNLPILQLVSIAVAPLIVVLIYEKSGSKYTMISFFVSMIMISVLLNPIQGVTLTALNYTIGIGLIWIVKKEYSAFINIIILTGALMLGVSVFFFLNLKLVLQTDFNGYLKIIIDTIDEALNMMATLYKENNMDINDNPAFKSLKSIKPDDILVFLPVYLTMYSVIVSTFIYKISEKILGRLNIRIKPMPKLSFIKSNMKIIIVSLLISIVGAMSISINETLGVAISVLGNGLFKITAGLGGLSVVSFLLEKKLKYKSFLRFVWLFLFLGLGLSNILILVGVIDSAFDFRMIDNEGLYSIIKDKMKDTNNS